MTREEVTKIKKQIIKEFDDPECIDLSHYSNSNILEIIECFEKQEKKQARLQLELAAALQVLLNILRFHNPFETKETHKKIMDKYADLYERVKRK